MKLTGVGVGPGDSGLVTVNAALALLSADLCLIPTSGKGRESVAGNIVREFFGRYGEALGGRRGGAPGKSAEFFFPMTADSSARDEKISEQIEALRPLWENADTVAMPVIGDSALYSTVAYLYEVWRAVVPDLELALEPGVSAHSLAASRAGDLLAIGDEIFAVIPGNADSEAAVAALRVVDAAAVYKLSAFGDALPDIVRRSGPWESAVRVTRAGLPDESIVRGDEAFAPAEDYLSVLLLRRTACW